MKNLPTFEKFLNESVFITLKKTNMNEFMNDFRLKQDFEDAKRLLYDFTGGIFGHISGEEFELRTYTEIRVEDMDRYLSTINEQMKHLKFGRKGKSKKTDLKEFFWTIKAEISKI